MDRVNNESENAGSKSKHSLGQVKKGPPESESPKRRAGCRRNFHGHQWHSLASRRVSGEANP